MGNSRSTLWPNIVITKFQNLQKAIILQHVGHMCCPIFVRIAVLKIQICDGGIWRGIIRLVGSKSNCNRRNTCENTPSQIIPVKIQACRISEGMYRVPCGIRQKGLA